MRLVAFLIPILFLSVFPGAERARALVADLSNHLIAITTAFSGTDLLVFGAVEEPGSDIIVIVRGSRASETVMRKGRVGPIWINTDAITFDNVPSFFAMASSGPPAELAEEDELERHGLGITHLNLQPRADDTHAPAVVQAFADALIEDRIENQLFRRDVTQVNFVGNTLFRTTFTFPTTIAPGTYQVIVHEVRDGFVTAAQSSALVVSKVGLEADVFMLARQQPALYGLFSIWLAIGAGWAASALFGRR